MMRWTYKLPLRFRSLFRKERVERELDEELQFHLERQIEENLAAGMAPEEARYAALRALGGVEHTKEQCRDQRRVNFIEDFVQDLGYSLRKLRREPGVAMAVALTLSIGIGATTAVFSTINTALIRRIPFTEPDRLLIGLKTRNGTTGSGLVAGFDYLDYRRLGRSFDGLAALTPAGQQTVTGGTEPWVAEASRVTSNLFRVLQVNPVAGRHFLPEEEARGGTRVVLISFALWQNRFAGSSTAVGSTVNLDGSPHTIVGVMPRGFRVFCDADLWMLIDWTRSRGATNRNYHNYHVVGRLKSGVSIQQAQHDVDVISRGLEQQYPASNKGKGLRLLDLQGYMVQDVRAGLLLPSAVTMCLLLVACANVAGLLLARGQRRMSEMAMRSALGASRGRLVRQLLAESVMLTLPAGLLGVGIAHVFQNLLLRLLPMDRLGINQPVVDGAVLLFALLVSMVTGLVVGVVPAIRGTAVGPSPRLGTGKQVFEGSRSARLRSGLVVMQVAISVVLLIESGLLVRSLALLSTVNLGFDPNNVLTARIQMQVPDHSKREQLPAFFTSALEEIEGLPGVESASLIDKLPVVDPGGDWEIRRADRPRQSDQDDYPAFARSVSPRYFKTMRIPLLKGRDISKTDIVSTPRVMVISKTLARTLFADRDPVGRMVEVHLIDSPYVRYEVIGVVGDVRVNDLRGEGDLAMYLAAAQRGDNEMRVAIRTTGNPSRLVEPIRQRLRQKNRNVLVADLATMDSVLDDALSLFRVVIQYLGLFSGIALLLGAIGLYGALAYHVSQQEHEMGVRLAMGATRANVLLLVLGRGLLLVGTGLLLGVVGARPGTTLIQQFLYKIQPLDPSTYVCAVLLVGIAATMACFFPAWRATRVNPVEVLRSE
jgi:predicted permease